MWVVDYFGRRFGSYTLQAAIAAIHAEAESVAAGLATDCWPFQCAMVQRQADAVI